MRYEAPKTIKEAAGLMAKAKGSAFLLAGGTDLLVRLRSGLIEPDLVVDIKRIPSLQTVTRTAAGYRIGSAVPAAALGENAALKKAWPGVVEAANLIGSDQIQSRCTIVGNLCNGSPAADSVPAMVAAGATLFVGGPPDVAEQGDPYASFEGRKGAVIWAVSAADGKKLAECPLPAPPVFDGMAAAAGRLYISTTDGKVMCLAGGERR